MTIVSCNEKSQKIQSRLNSKDSSDQIATFENDNLQMNNAIAKAKDSFPLFLIALKNKCNTCTDFAVKMRFMYGEGSGEHIWLNNLYFDDNKLMGEINNIPENIDRIKLGDTIEIEKDSLSDWIYIKDGNLMGGYTLKVMYDKMSETEKKQLENDIGAKIK